MGLAVPLTVASSSSALYSDTVNSFHNHVRTWPLQKQLLLWPQKTFRERRMIAANLALANAGGSHDYSHLNPKAKCKRPSLNLLRGKDNKWASASTVSVLCAVASESDIKKNEETFSNELLDIKEIKERCKKWLWKGHTINYLIYNHQEEATDDKNKTTKPPLLLVHGFGASIAHWRRNVITLGKSYTVYAIDLLGFGASDKPMGFAYTMEAWAQLILDFLDEIVQRPTVLIGNSVGSLACVIAASEPNQSLVRGLVLLNCAGGMNNKAVVDDWRIKLLLPLLWLFDFLLRQRWIASSIFERVKERDNLQNILLSVYGNKESVDDDLVEIIRMPANDEGALDAFVSIVTGPPGPSPVQLMPKISLPVLVLWGDEDPFTPLDGPVGKYFSSLPSNLPNISLFVLPGVGHCPHDDRAYLVHEKLLPWLASLPSS